MVWYCYKYVIMNIKNFHSCTIEVWEWTSNVICHFIMDVITYPCWDEYQSVKGVPRKVQWYHIITKQIPPMGYIPWVYALHWLINMRVSCTKWVTMIISPNHYRNMLSKNLHLTHCGLVTPNGVGDLGQHWLRKWLVAWRHQAITWTSIDLIINEVFRHQPEQFHRKCIRILFLDISFKVANLRSQPHLPGANELINHSHSHPFMSTERKTISNSIVSTVPVDAWAVLGASTSAAAMVTNSMWKNK